MPERSPLPRPWPPSAYDHLAPLFAALARLEPGHRDHADIRERLITGHQPLAAHIAHRFSIMVLDQEELDQVATASLIHAIDRFDPGRDTDFLAFAVPAMLGDVRRYARDMVWPKRTPRHLREPGQAGEPVGDASLAGEDAPHRPVPSPPSSSEPSPH